MRGFGEYDLRRQAEMCFVESVNFFCKFARKIYGIFINSVNFRLYFARKIHKIFMDCHDLLSQISQ